MHRRRLLPALSLLLGGVVPVLAGMPPAQPTPPPPSTPAAIQGVVRGPGAKPIENALVIALANKPAPGESPATVRTDAQGRFSLTVRRAARYSVRAESSGLAGQTVRDVAPGAPLTIDLAAGGAIEGIVRDGDTGQPAAGVRVGTRDAGAVALYGEPDAGRIEATTDAEGRFKLIGLAAGRHDVSARARGRGFASRQGVAVGARIELLLQPAATIVGTISGPDGAPVAGAIVTPVGVRSARAPRPERSDARGRYEVMGLDAGIYDVAVRAPGLAPAVVADVALDARGEARVDVALRPGARVTGRLVDANDKPLAGRVAIGELGSSVVPYVLADLLRADVGADGRFALDAVPAGAHALGAEARGQGPKRVDLEVSSTQRALDLGDIHMVAGLVLRGRVRSASGQPIADASIQAQPIRSRSGVMSHGRTDGDGTFALGGLEAQTYRVVANAVGFGVATESADPGPDALELVLEAAGTISGKVVDDRGRPIESFRILARPIGDQGPTKYDDVAAADGRFVLEDVDAGSYEVTVESADRAPGSASAKVAAGGTADVGTITLGAGRTLRGTVVDSSGTFVAGAKVTLTYSRREGTVWMSDAKPEILTDRAGAFEAKGVKDGPVEINASHASYARALPVEIVVDAAPVPDVRLVLTQGGRIEGSFRKRDGSPMAGAFVVATPMREEPWHGAAPLPVQPDGTFVIEHVPAGRVRVTTMTASGLTSFRSAQVRELDVRDGETAALDIVNREILLNGRVVRAGGSASGLRIDARGSGIVSFGARGQTVPPSGRGVERMVAVTREDGSFEMLLDEPGNVSMSVWSPDMRFRLPERRIQVPDADAFAAELVFEGAPVTGIVVDKDTDRPLAYALVTAGSKDGQSSGANVTTGPDGRFQFELAPGSYRLNAHAKDGSYVRTPVDVGVPAAGVADVRLALSRGMRITGRATDPSGRPLADVRVGAFSFADSLGETRSMADGTFEMRGLRNVDHQVTAWSDAGLFAIRAGVGAGTTDLPLRMQPAGRVTVEVVSADGQPVPGVAPQVGNIDNVPNMTSLGRCVAPSDARGRARLLTPAGRIVVRANQGTLQGYATVEVAPGEPATVRVTLEKANAQQMTAR